ncbi:MAG: 50S ribosomal protein L33 [Chlamydiae bacterium]|nr:50S ribosomal protein L33 [Chlamydiota bacterium]
MARENIKLKSEESSEYYYTTKNKKTNPERLVMKKFDKTLRKHVIFKETK